MVSIYWERFQPLHKNEYQEVVWNNVVMCTKFKSELERGHNDQLQSDIECSSNPLLVKFGEAQGICYNVSVRCVEGALNLQYALHFVKTNSNTSFTLRTLF